MTVDKTILGIHEAEKKAEEIVAEAHTKAASLLEKADREAATWLQSEKEKILNDKEQQLNEKRKLVEKASAASLEKARRSAHILEQKAKKKYPAAVACIIGELKKQVGMK